MTYRKQSPLEPLRPTPAAFTDQETEQLRAYAHANHQSLRAAVRTLTLRGLQIDAVDNRLDYTQENNPIHS